MSCPGHIGRHCPDRLAGSDASAADVDKHGAEARAKRFLDVIEDHLRANDPLFYGNRLSAADFYLVMLRRVTALPSVRRAYKQEGITAEVC
jgi:glutathione S-transferase